jgi:hypothetical protein
VKTWKLELAVVVIVLGVTTWVSGVTAQNVIALLAICLTFCHVQIADRMREADEARSDPAVRCRNWLNRYFVAKETLWVAFFLVSGSYTAIVGSALFLLYPFWRRTYRRIKPLN